MKKEKNIRSNTVSKINIIGQNPVAQHKVVSVNPFILGQQMKRPHHNFRDVYANWFDVNHVRGSLFTFSTTLHKRILALRIIMEGISNKTAKLLMLVMYYIADQL